MNRLVVTLLICISFVSCKNDKKSSDTDGYSGATKMNGSLIYPEETNFKTLRQVTYGGDNAEAYWSFDDKQLVFQSNSAKWGNLT